MCAGLSRLTAVTVKHEDNSMMKPYIYFSKASYIHLNVVLYVIVHQSFRLMQRIHLYHVNDTPAERCIASLMSCFRDTTI